MSNYLGRPFFIALLGLLSFFSPSAQSHDSDSASKVKDYKSIIKFNLTSTILYRSRLIEYERMVRKNQSFLVRVGLVVLLFASSRSSDSLQLKEIK